MDFKLENIVVPVSDVDRARDFYVQQAGFHLDVDHRAGDHFRVVQLTPPGSACSITLMHNAAAAGSLGGLHLVVEDAQAAHAALARRGLAVGDLVHWVDGEQRPGPDPERRAYGTFFSFNDPDGTGWLVQEVRRAAEPSILR